MKTWALMISRIWLDMLYNPGAGGKTSAVSRRLLPQITILYRTQHECTPQITKMTVKPRGEQYNNGKSWENTFGGEAKN